MRVQIAIPEEHVKKPVLDGALEAVTRLNEDLIKSGVSPTSDQLIQAGARWKPEKPGDEHFDHGAVISKRGHGDCDDWAPLHAATLRVTGEDRGARAIVKKSGPKRWHAIVQRSDGSIDDPSSEAGMPGPGMATGVRGASVPLMQDRVHGVDGTFIARPHLALRPVMDRDGQLEAWQARADLPWHWSPGDGPADAAMVSLHQSPVSDQAVVGAVRGAFSLGLSSGMTHPEHLKRMSAIAEACEGAPWEEIAERYGEEHADAAGQIVGGFFGKAFKALKKVAMPLARGALSFVPGGNAALSLAESAYKMASPMLKKSVATQQHVAPEQRGAIQPARIVTPGGDINVQLLTRFGDLLADAYRSPRSSSPAWGAAPRAPARAPARRAPARARATVWPRR